MSEFEDNTNEMGDEDLDLGGGTEVGAGKDTGEGAEPAVEGAEPEAKAEKPDELLETFQGWIAEDMAEDDIIVKLHADHDMTFPQAVNRYRKLKSQAGLTAPKGHKSEDVRAFMQASIDAGMERADIIAAMVEKYGYTKKSAASTFSVQGKKLGITGDGSGMAAKVPMADTVAFMRNNVELKKQEFVAKMAETLGYAESTCGAFYTYIPMAVEWAKQELVANAEVAKPAAKPRAKAKAKAKA